MHIVRNGLFSMQKLRETITAANHCKPCPCGETQLDTSDLTLCRRNTLQCQLQSVWHSKHMCSPNKKRKRLDGVTCSRLFCQRPQGLSSRISLSSSLSSSLPPDPDSFSGTDIVILAVRAPFNGSFKTNCAHSTYWGLQRYCSCKRVSLTVIEECWSPFQGVYENRRAHKIMQHIGKMSRERRLKAR